MLLPLQAPPPWLEWVIAIRTQVAKIIFIVR
jgi:hypothetical protein